MSKRCGRCEKVVYPIEELKCLDKVWHKGCFKCNECHMTLSMKTYKGFNKLPYCDAHIPKAKATTVAETPESKRLAENTKIQSNVQYHAEFEKNKARFTQVSDDPETLRLQQNTKNISNTTYHGDLEKKADMENRRDKNSKSASPIQPSKEKHTESAPVAQNIPPQMSQRPVPSGQYTSGSGPKQQQQHYQQQQQQQYNRMAQSTTQGNNHYYQGQPTNYSSQSQYPKQVMHQTHTQQQSPTHRHPPQQQHHHHHQPPPQPYHHQYNNSSTQAYAYQDANRNPSTQQYGARPSQTLVYSSQTGPIIEASENVGSIVDYDPLNNQYGSISSHGRPQTAPAYRQDSNKGQRGHYHRDAQQMPMHNQHVGQQQHSHQKITAPPTNLGRCYRAIYDYEAADSDEVSFKDGDLIVNCTSIDEGWMTGTVQRSGHVGMLPANYVQRVN